MPVIPLVPSDSPKLISSLLRLSAHHLTLAASASQPLKSRTLSLHLSVPVPVLIPSVVISRPTTASRPSTPLNPSPLAPQIRLCWPLCAFINYIFTYLPGRSGTRTRSFSPCSPVRPRGPRLTAWGFLLVSSNHSYKMHHLGLGRTVGIWTAAFLDASYKRWHSNTLTPSQATMAWDRISWASSSVPNLTIGNESVPIQLAQCWLPGLAISNAKNE